VGEGGRPRWLDRLLRGPDAPFIAADLREAMERDLARGVPRWRARLRFVRNALGSAASTWRAHWRPERPIFSWLDVKLGWRMLWKNPLLTIVAVASLAVGIPLGLAPAHVAEALDAELPVPEGDRLRALRFREAGRPVPRMGSYEFLVWRDALESFEALAAVHSLEHALDPGSGIASPVKAAHVTGEAFPILRTPPRLGRTLAPSDAAPGAPRAVVIGHELWLARFGGDREVIGRTVLVAGVPHTVVGVMPEDFEFPMGEQLWLPLPVDPSARPGEGPSVAVFGRLAAGVREAAAGTEVAAVDSRLRAAAPDRYEDVHTEVVSIPVIAVGAPREGLRSMPVFRLFDVLGLVLLAIACANVGVLIFARTANRTADMAVRSALGASRMRIVSQVCTEAFVMALLAAGAGLVLVQVFGNWLVTAFWSPHLDPLPWWVDMGVTTATAARAVVLAVLAAVLSALIPALRVTGRGVQRTIRESEAGRSGIRFGGVSSVLIAVQVAIAVGALGLLVAAGGRVADMETERGLGGVTTDGYLAAQIRLPVATGTGLGTLVPREEASARGAVLQQDLVARLEADPEVRAVAVGSHLPRMQHNRVRFEVEGMAGGDTLISRWVFSAQVAPGFFEAFGTGVVSGRGFHASDLEEGSTAVLVNASFRDRVLRGADPVGRRVRLLERSGEPQGPWWEIVGVVPDLGVNIFEPGASEAVYRPAVPGRSGRFWLAVDVGRDPAAFGPRLRELVGALDATALVSELRPLGAFYPDDRYMILATAAGLIFLVIALLTMSGSGIYAIMSFAVAQRTREIGIRTALGARPLHVAATVGRRAAAQLGAGVLLGIPLARWLYVFVHADAGAIIQHAWMAAAIPGLFVLLLMGSAACAVPLARALRITPNEALREG
jgi:predicted permease